MGLRFRKSFGSGPFRVNLSKSGIGYSVGTKGARITKKAGGGARATVGTSGVYYTKDFGGGSVSRKKKTKKKSGCLTWIGGIVAVLAVIGLFGSCSPEEPESNIPEEAPAIVEEQEQAPEVTEEPEEPEEKEVIEFEPVFVDPYTGEHTTGREEGEDSEVTTPVEPPVEESPIVQEPVIVPEDPVVETPDPVVEPDPITPPVVEPEPVSPPAAEPEPVAPPVVEPEPAPQGQIVYITEHGSKYHNAWCSSLSKSCIETTLEYVESKNMEPCKNCH